MLAAFSAEIAKLILKFKQKDNGPPIARPALTKNKVGGRTLPNVNFTRPHNHEDGAGLRKEGQSLKGPEINPYINRQLSFKKGVRSIQQEENSLSTNGHACAKK